MTLLLAEKTCDSEGKGTKMGESRPPKRLLQESRQNDGSLNQFSCGEGDKKWPD